MLQTLALATQLLSQSQTPFQPCKQWLSALDSCSTALFLVSRMGHRLIQLGFGLILTMPCRQMLFNAAQCIINCHQQVTVDPANHQWAQPPFMYTFAVVGVNALYNTLKHEMFAVLQAEHHDSVRTIQGTDLSLGKLSQHVLRSFRCLCSMQSSTSHSWPSISIVSSMARGPLSPRSIRFAADCYSTT